MKRLLTSIGLLLLTSCTTLAPAESPLTIPPQRNGSSTRAAPTSGSTLSPLATPAGSISTPGSSARQSTLIQRAILDLAQRLDTEPSAIEFDRIESNDFPADGLGCPGQPAGNHPAFVMGQSIWLRANNLTYEYRARGTELIYCGSHD